MFCLKISVVIVLLAVFYHSSDGQTDQEWLCGACRIMNFEIVREINSADDSKTTIGGSYRIDPQGNQKTFEKKYKRSQLHIHEVMEKVCDHMMQYGRLISSPVGKTDKIRKFQFVRTTTADGQTSEYVDRSQEVRTKLQHKCDDILEDHEDWLEEFFTKEVTAADGDRELCLMRAGYCKMDDLVHSLIPPPIPSPKKEEEKPAEPAQEQEPTQEQGPEQDKNTEL